MMISARQCRAARILIQVGRSLLATAAGGLATSDDDVP